MAQVSVNIGGRAYRLACNPGEEAHLEGLGQALDGKIAEMRAAFGEIGDQRLIVMAALTIADEVAEARLTAKREAARAEAALADAEAAQRKTKEGRQAADLRALALTQTLDELTRKLDTLSATLSGREAAE